MTTINNHQWISQCNQFTADGKTIMARHVFKIVDYEIQCLGIVMLEIKNVNSSEIFKITKSQFDLTFEIVPEGE